MSNRNDKAGPSRRGFLKQSGAALAGAALVSSIGSRSYAAGDETLKIGLVGAGGRGTGAAREALNTSGPTKLWAMADIFEGQVNSSFEGLSHAPDVDSEQLDCPEERRFVGLDAFKQCIDSGVDVVILATPPGWRPQHFEYAVEQGKNVFMEKPVAVDGPGVRRVLAAAERAREKNLKVGVGLQRHHDIGYQETIKRLHDGEIGDIHTLRVYWNGSGVWTRARRPDDTEMQYQNRNWYYFNWLCGDHIVEQHIHNIDVANWVKGAYPVLAQGMGGRQVRTGDRHGEIYDHHMVEFTYEDGSTMISQCRHIGGCWNSVSEYAHGSKGSAVVSGYQIYDSQRQDADSRVWRFDGARPSAYQVEHDVLFDSIRNDREHAEAENGAMATMTAILGRMCTYSGQRIPFQRALEQGRELAPGQDEYTWDSEPPVMPDADGGYPVAQPGEYEPFEA